MLNHYQRLIVGLVLIGNIIAVAYIAFIVWLGAGWMLDDHLAATLSDWGWIYVALQRVIIGSIFALLIGGLLFGINALFLRMARVSSSRVPLSSAIVASSIITGAAVIGSVQFVITKPFM